MAIFVSVHNDLFSGMIALLSAGSPLITDELWRASTEDRNALRQKLLLGDCFSLNGRIGDCLLAVMGSHTWKLGS